MKRNIRFCVTSVATLVCSIFVSVACEKSPVTEPEPEQPAELVPIVLTAPENGTSIDLVNAEPVVFSWKNAKGVNSYKIRFSRSADLSKPYDVRAMSNPVSYKYKAFDGFLEALGVKNEETATIWWSVIASDKEDKFDKQVRSLTVKRLPAGPEEPYEQRIADPITVKVAILYEDPIMPGTDKYMHEVCTVGGNGYKWNDPVQQAKKFETDLEEASHGVIQYEVVKEVRAERLFSYDNTKTGSEKEYFSIEYFRDVIYANGHECPGIGSGVEYDYVGMLKYYGFDKMRDAGEIQEVWVYNHPGCGMYESRLIGDGAFWCNSPGISVGAPCKDLVTVMFCNYERTTDLALHSYGHRFESIMKQVYGSWRNRADNNLPARESELNNWERYACHNLEYDRYEKGHAQIGCTHFPPNGRYDYDYDNRADYVYTYADCWYDYPKMVMANPRRVNSSEWKNGQQGWMMYFFSHMPHFKGINEDVNDLHLNNWWYYVVDWNAAKKYERELRNNYEE